MYCCNYCDEKFDEPAITRICFEEEYGVGHLFESRNYTNVQCCPACSSTDIEKMETCDMCGEYFKSDDLTDTTEYINGGVGYCCEGCMQDADMRAI